MRFRIPSRYRLAPAPQRPSPSSGCVRRPPGTTPGRCTAPGAGFAPVLALLCALATSCASTIPGRIGAGLPADVAEYFAGLGIARYPSTRPLLFHTGQAWMERATTLVDGARDHILVSTFLLAAHPVHAPLVDALVRAAARGVRVHVLYDSSSYYTYTPEKTSYFVSGAASFAGTAVRTAEYNPISGEKLFALPFLLHRDHRKFWIVDGERIATGGINLNYYSLLPDHQGGNTDTFAEIGSPGAIRAMIDSFCETWNDNSVDSIDPASFPVRGSPDEVPVWVLDQTLRSGPRMDDFFDAFFLYARREIWMIQAYSFTTKAMVDKIRAATKRGVRVNLVLSDNSFRTVYDGAARYCMLDFLDAGAVVHVFDSPEKSFLHYKLMLADDRLAGFGSANFNLRSLYLAGELSFVFDDPLTGAEVRRNIDSLLAHTRIVGRDEAAGYRTLRNFIDYVSMLYGG